ncbi:hypothetical protein [Staphylococcus epidermidis]|uniref:hypothetical protein n=1 Tax=Staphylococcus epidermidis TaxID=1282 RepID=UPI0011A5175E|nr:hypothetical protein [Staphylococcus epidermidis]
MFVVKEVEVKGEMEEKLEIVYYKLRNDVMFVWMESEGIVGKESKVFLLYCVGGVVKVGL